MEEGPPAVAKRNDRLEEPPIGKLVAFFARYCGWLPDQVLDEPWSRLVVVMGHVGDFLTREQEFSASLVGAKLKRKPKPQTGSAPVNQASSVKPSDLTNLQRLGILEG